MNTLTAAQKYIEHGYAVIPVPPGQKGCKTPKWQLLRLKTPDLAKYFMENSNIGVLLGDASGGLIDIDLDCAEAVQLAPHFLPSTSAIFGRKSRGRGHYLYHCPALNEHILFKCGDMILELRGASNKQTMFPPSVHPSGESVTWYEEGTPAFVDEDELLDACQKLALAAVMLRHWPEQGSRHNFALYLSGFLLQTLEWSAEDAAHLIEIVATAAGDNEVSDRVNTVVSTLATFEAGEPVKGISGLLETMPADVMNAVQKWFKIKKASSKSKRTQANTLADSSIFDAMIEEMNKRHAFVQLGGKPAILREDSNGKRYEILSYEFFNKAFMNQTMLNNAGRPESISSIWMKHPKRRQYLEGVKFAPNQTLPDGYYNMFKGWPLQPDASGSCDIFLEHIRDNVCQGNEEHYQYIIAWFADIFQRADSKPGICLVFRGEKGTGKSKIGETFAPLLGDYYVKLSQARHLLGNFNSHTAARLLIQAEEGYWAGDKQGEGVFKDLITSDMMLLEHKGKDATQIASYCRILMTTNNDWAVPATGDERRFAVFDIANTRRQDSAYFAAMDEQMKQGGYARLMHEMLHFDLNSVNLRKAPQTEALTEQKILSMSGFENWWLAALESMAFPHENIPHNLCWRGWDVWKTMSEVFIPTEMLLASYIAYCQAHGVRYKSSPTSFGMQLKKLLGDHFRKERRFVDIRYKNQEDELKDFSEVRYVYVIPNVEKCRAIFDEKMGQPHQWITECSTEAEF
jgi:hypothetical protein